MKDRVEFYWAGGLVVSVESSIVPPVDSLISIKGKTWRVDRVTYAVDYADDCFKKILRANVDLEEQP